MTRKRSSRILIALLVASMLLVPAAVASADSHGGYIYAPPPPVTGPRLAPPAIPHTDVLENQIIYNDQLAGGIPVQSLEADAADGGKTQEKPGRGIKQIVTEYAYGLQLYDVPFVCNDFNTEDQWPSTKGETDIWTDWYAGWAPYAVDEGYYQAKNVTFSRERVVGPGNNFGDNQHSAKIASNQPYAAGFGSPLIKVPAGYENGQAYVKVNYLIWDHDTGGGWGDGWDYDWASMGIKVGDGYASYVNGYDRGQWGAMTHVVPVDGASEIMVLLQGHSPASLNSNIYFDNVQIAFVDDTNSAAYLADCKLAAE